MIRLYGFAAYTGLAHPTAEMAWEQEALWIAEHTPTDASKSDVERLKEAAEADRKRLQPGH